MRYVLGLVFLLLFAGFITCTILLGGPSNVSAYRNISFGGALICAAFSAVALGILALGIGAKGKKINPWGVAFLCVVALLVSFSFGIYILTLEMPEVLRPLSEKEIAEDAALEVKLKFCAFAMILLGLFSFGSLIVTLIRAKRHNSKLSD